MDNVIDLNNAQRQAVDLKALAPNMTIDVMAKKVGVHRNTIANWLANPAFNEAIYDKFMEMSGHRLPAVLDAMIREAEEGSVPAATLILKHFGKLQDQVTIKIDSPFEKFLKLGEIQNGDFTEAEIVDTVKAIGVTEDLPPRNEENDKPKFRHFKQVKRLKGTERLAYKRLKENERIRTARQQRDRAKKIGLDLLPPGRATDVARRKWVRKLVRLEKKLGVYKED
jgi:transposase